MDRVSVEANYNIVIVGAGPSGSSAAIRLTNAGRKVLLVDKARFPRHKLCGEFISPECLDHLKELGAVPNVNSLRPPSIDKTVFYSSGGRSFSIDSRWLAHNHADSIGLSRKALDQILLDRAIECGAAVETETSVLNVTVSEGGAVRLEMRSPDASTYEVTAPIVIEATGRGRYIARKFDGQANKVKPRQVAFKAHLRSAVIEPGACEIFSFHGGYGGCSPVEDGLFNLCFVVDARLVRSIGTDPNKILKATVLQNKRAATVLADMKVEGDWISVPIARYGALDPAPIPGILAIGDAAAFIDPFTGSGIAMALESSQIACEAIVKNQEPRAISNIYRLSHAAAFRKRLLVCRGLRFFSSSPKLADAIIAGLGTSEILRRFFARLTRGTSVEERTAE